MPDLIHKTCKMLYDDHEMKKIDQVLRELAQVDWHNSMRQAGELSEMEKAARQLIVAAGFTGISCRAASFESGELHLTVEDSAALTRLRQMRAGLLSALQKQFPAIKSLRLGVQL